MLWFQSDLGQKRTEVKNLTFEVETKSETILNLETQLKVRFHSSGIYQIILQKSEELVISQIETERALRMQIKQDAEHVAQNKV